VATFRRNGWQIWRGIPKKAFSIAEDLLLECGEEDLNLHTSRHQHLKLKLVEIREYHAIVKNYVQPLSTRQTVLLIAADI
jgi:hypothetical protein